MSKKIGKTATMKKLIYILIFLALLGFSAHVYNVLAPEPKLTGLPQTPPPKDCTFSESDLLTMINSVRTHKLTMDAGLDNISQSRSESIPYELDDHAGFRKLAAMKVFEHRFKMVSENLESNRCPSAKNLFEQWKNSPGHWRNITRESFDVIGIGFNKSQGTAVTIFGDYY